MKRTRMVLNHLTPLIGAATLCLMTAAPVLGQIFTCFQTTKLTALDAGASHLLGNSVDLDGNVAVAGTTGALAAYVYRFNGSTWLQEQKLTASDGGATDFFGLAVSVSGDVVVVTKPNDDCIAGTLCGSAYVFRFNGSSWIEEQKLTASDADASDRFGTSVSVDGNVAIVGAMADECTAGADCGSAYVFRFNGTTWDEEQKLTASDATAFDEFGFSVSVHDTVIVVGALDDVCAAGLSCGSAYIFRFDGLAWIEEQKLVASDADALDLFGVSVAVRGSVALIGANRDDCPAGTLCGSAYVFRFNGTSWTEEQKLAASDAAANDRFGCAVSVDGDLALVGSRESNCAAGADCGSAYAFRFNGSSWDQIVKMSAVDAAATDRFGTAVALDDGVALAGAPNDDCGAGSNCGAAYVFHCQDVNPGTAPAVSQLGLATILLPLATAGAIVFTRGQRGRHRLSTG